VTTCHFDDCLSVSFKGRHDGENPAPSVRQLKSINEIYRLVTEVTSDCLWEWDLRSRQILWIDGGHKRAFGYPIENALIPMRFWETRLHPEDKGRVLKSLHAFFANGMAVNWEEEYRFRKFNGDYAHVHVRGQLVYNGDKRTSLMIGATQDISARKSAEAQMHKAEGDLAQQLLDNQKQIFAAVLIAREKDRNLMGTELHDNVNQILAATKMLLSIARSDARSITECLGPAIDNIQHAIDETRRIAHELVAAGL
jgi:two-component system sensor histidine kinase UhpB